MSDEVMYNGKQSSGTSEIVEEETSSELFEINHRVPLPPIREDVDGSMFSLDIQGGEDNVYVAVGKSESSMDALLWTLKHAVSPSTLVYLIHVFPELRHIPTPLGKLPKSQVSPEQVESYTNQERSKRRELLQKFLSTCSTSKVNVDTLLIESDAVAKAILDLIPILNIKKLVLGTTKYSLRRLRSRRGGGIADQVLQGVTGSCDIKVICQGKEVTDQTSELPSPRSASDRFETSPEEDQRSDNTSSCACFKPKFM